MKNIIIFGSCVSRDPFERSIEGEVLNVKNYYARSTFASIFSNPYVGNFDFNLLNSSFQRRMVFNDANKSFVTILNQFDQEYLLLDFTDDRFPVLIFNDGSVLTESSELGFIIEKNDCFNVNIKKRIKPFSDEYFEIWCSGFEHFWDLVSQLKISNRIIINKIYWAYLDSVGNEFDFKFVTAANSYFDRVYVYLSRFFSPEQFVNYHGIEFIGDVNHRWGRAPFHFSAEVESRLLDFVSKFKV